MTTDAGTESPLFLYGINSKDGRENRLIETPREIGDFFSFTVLLSVWTVFISDGPSTVTEEMFRIRLTYYAIANVVDTSSINTTRIY